MEQVELTAYLRDERGKQANKRLRKAGLIPAVVYGHNEETLALCCESEKLSAVLHTSARENVVAHLKIMDADRKKQKKSETVIVRQVQYDSLRGDILHVDFNHISLKKKITVKVPVETKGESPGVKLGGLLEHVLWEIEVECLPTNIPEKIVIDISQLQIGDTIHIKDLLIPEDVQPFNEPDQSVLTIEPPKAEVAEEMLEEGDKKEEEPEVTKQKKPEEVETEAGKQPKEKQAKRKE